MFVSGPFCSSNLYDAFHSAGIVWPVHSAGSNIIRRDITAAAAAAAVLHTSASLTINENASPDVPLDLNDALDKIVPEGNHYRHLDEGYDDMPAHVKVGSLQAVYVITRLHIALHFICFLMIHLSAHEMSPCFCTLSCFCGIHSLHVHGLKAFQCNMYKRAL